MENNTHLMKNVTGNLFNLVTILLVYVSRSLYDNTQNHYYLFRKLHRENHIFIINFK